MAINDAYFGAGAYEAARGAQAATNEWPEYNGGMSMPRRWPVPIGNYIYRFASSRVPHHSRPQSEWWMEFSVLRTIARVIRDSGGSRRDAVRYMLALPWSWTPVDRLLRARTTAPLDAYRGLGKPAQGTHVNDRNTVYIPPQHLQELYQLYIPGMRNLAHTVLCDLSDEDIWSSSRLN